MRFYFLLFCSFYLQPLSAQDNWAYPYSIDDKWGIVSSDNQIVTEPIYDKVCLFSNNSDATATYSIVEKDDYYGLVRPNGSFILPMDYKFISSDWLCNDFVIVFTSKGFGLASVKDGSFPFKSIYSEIRPFKGYVKSVAIMQVQGRFGCINNEGKIIAEAKYASVKYLNPEADMPIMELSKKDGSVSYIDAFGKPAKPEDANKNDEFAVFNEAILGMEDKAFTTLSFVKKEIAGKKCFVFKLIKKTDRSDNYELTKDTICSYDGVYTAEIDPYAENLSLKYAVVERDGKKGVINGQREEIIACNYDRITPEDQYFNLRKGNYVGLADINGNIIFDAVFQELREYSSIEKKFNGRYYKLKCKNGLIVFGNKAGDVFIPEDYESLINSKTQSTTLNN